MVDGYFGRILKVHLTQEACCWEDLPPEAVCSYLGGYGLGVSLLLQRIPRGADPLGPDNVLAFCPGLLTGTPAPFSGRFMICGRSPLTGAWGESNCGGHFGPVLRSTGLDALLIHGSADRPVYLFIDERGAEVREAAHLWGLDVLATERQLKSDLGSGVQVTCIGPAGEQRSLLAAIMTDGGRAAARCGLGAVMGAKRLKAVVVQGSREIALHDRERLVELSREYARVFSGATGQMGRLLAGLGRTFAPLLRRLRIKPSGGPTEAIVHIYREYGTCFGTAFSTEMGDAPVRNWQGAAAEEFPLSRSARISDAAVVERQARRYHCRRCPVGCGGILTPAGGGGTREISLKPEYETLAAFGSLLLNDDLDAIIQANDLCNRFGLDTISVGATVAFALECYESGTLDAAATGGLELRWGDGQAVVELVERIAAREEIGDVLADGVQRAAKRIGGTSWAAAMHVGGQELPMHDPRYEPLMGVAYVADATPGRHGTANGGVYDVPALREVFAAAGVKPPGRYDYEGKGALFALLSRYMTVVDSAGLCAFSLLMGEPPIREWINAATGWDLGHEGLLKIGHRIQVARHLFNQRQGILPDSWDLPPRVAGSPPLQEGPLKGVTLDMDAMLGSYREAMGYDVGTGLPPNELVRGLGLSPWID